MRHPDVLRNLPVAELPPNRVRQRSHNRPPLVPVGTPKAGLGYRYEPSTAGSGGA